MKISLKRGVIQAAFTVATNLNIKGFALGEIYTGNTKHVCVPGLNCYSCPGAIAACPLGSLQNAIASPSIKFPAYVLGTILLFGLIAGRFICSFLCPFGFFQDLLHKIPTKKIKISKNWQWVKYIKYAILLFFVILLPLLVLNEVNYGDPWFCKYICPSGTIFGAVPLLIANEGLREAAGLITLWKMGLAVIIVVLSIFIYRMFCRTLCPLGAIYGLMNKISFFRLELDRDKCINCGRCKRVCKMQVDPSKTPHSPECIRCLDCVEVCPVDALKATKYFKNKKIK